MQQKDAKELLHKYREGLATEAEKDLLGDWVLFGKLKELDLTDEEIETELSIIDNGLPLYKVRRLKLWPRIAAAAAILLSLSFGTYFLLHKKISDDQVAQNQIHDIAPGGNKAILTLSNGKQIILDQAKNGVLVKEGNIAVNKKSAGQLVYNSSGNTGNMAISYNTLTTPRGGQYQVDLPDGTKVWLNASSSLKYPTAFTGVERDVELTGEAYFEVAHNKAKPFHVRSGNQVVEVLGTHFNINAYANEPDIKTTLLEGSVRVTKHGQEALLKPGQQSIIQSSGSDNNSILVKEANTDVAIAWKDGYFRFENTTLPVILRQFSRWYDITIVNNHQLDGQYFSGKISRNSDISRVLRILEQGGVHYELNGRQLIIDDK
jgi:transmembrane sensor